MVKTLAHLDEERGIINEHFSHKHRGINRRSTMFGTLILDEEVVMITIEGLGLEYDSFMTSLTSKSSNMFTFQELQGLLPDQEKRMKCQTTPMTFPIATL